ncbi:MAG: hypothetical protein L0Z53_15080 [Acidobacteriales bacterium]|nr:hypothetical protein [Terriglobales bacterium]
MTDHPTIHDSDAIFDRLYHRLIDTLRRRREEINVLQDDHAVLLEDNNRLRLELGERDDEIAELRRIIEAYCDETQASQMQEQLAHAVNSTLALYLDMRPSIQEGDTPS